MVILIVRSRGDEEAIALWGEIVSAIDEMQREARRSTLTCSGLAGGASGGNLQAAGALWFGNFASLLTVQGRG
jgi:hypothetical protein